MRFHGSFLGGFLVNLELLIPISLSIGIVLLFNTYQFKRMNIVSIINICIAFILSLYNGIYYHERYLLLLLVLVIEVIVINKKIITVDIAVLLIIYLFFVLDYNILLFLTHLVGTIAGKITKFDEFLIGVLIIVSLIVVYLLLKNNRNKINKIIETIKHNTILLKTIISVVLILLFSESLILFLVDIYGIRELVQGFLIAFLGIVTGMILLILDYYIVMYQEKVQYKLQREKYIQQEKYLSALEKSYQDLRKARHDYQNTLLAIQGAINEKNILEAENYLKEILKQTNNDTKNEAKILFNLNKIKLSGIRNLLAVKIKKMQEFGIKYTMEVMDDIDNLPGDIVSIVRIIGILVDNAIEASQNQDNPQINLALIKYNSKAYSFSIVNKINKKVELNKIIERGYTTKENHTGLGLDNVLQLVEKSENFTLEINQSNNTIEFDFMMEGM